MLETMHAFQFVYLTYALIEELENTYKWEY